MSTHTGIILPVAYFPPISFFACLASGTDILIETGETFPRRSLRNRCEIAGSQGRQVLVVPASRPGGNHTRTHEIRISPHEDWRKKHWRSFETAYSSSPFFLYYSESILTMISGTSNSLAELDLNIIQNISSLIGLKSTITISDGYIKDTGEQLDLRKAFSLRPTFLSGKIRPYPQVFLHKTGFLGDLSILDLLFNLGPSSLAYLQEVGKAIPLSSG